MTVSEIRLNQRQILNMWLARLASLLRSPNGDCPEVLVAASEGASLAAPSRARVPGVGGSEHVRSRELVKSETTI